MSVVPANYAVAAITNLVPAVDNDETRARTAQVESYGAIITSEDPTVSVEAKMSAINALRDMGKGSRAAGAQDALTKATWYVSESPFAKAMDSAGARFSAEMMSAGRSMQARGDGEPNAGQLNLDALGRRPSDEQKLIAYNMGFSSIDSWKESLQQQASDYAARNPVPAVKVTLSDEAKAALTRSARASDDAPRSSAEQALEDLTKGGDSTGDGVAAAALSVLQSAAEARKARAAEANSKSSQGQAASEAPRPNAAQVMGGGFDRVV
jgi:hypothetical protein